MVLKTDRVSCWIQRAFDRAESGAVFEFLIVMNGHPVKLHHDAWPSCAIPFFIKKRGDHLHAISLPGQRKKSKSTTTSNWALRELTPRQLLYAANDAFAALKIMEALQAEGHLEQ